MLKYTRYGQCLTMESEAGVGVNCPNVIYGSAFKKL